MTCEQYRNQLALRPDEPDAELDAHLASCPLCSRINQRVNAFDTVLRSTLITPVPEDLTLRLLALVPGLSQPLVRSKRWMRQRRALMIGGGLVGLLALAALMYGLYLLGAAMGVGDVLATIGSWPGLAIDWLYRTVPSSRQIVASLIAMRQPLQWGVLLALIWLIWERMPYRQAAQSLAG